MIPALQNQSQWPKIPFVIGLVLDSMNLDEGGKGDLDWFRLDWALSRAGKG